jgi:hypothetical protein
MPAMQRISAIMRESLYFTLTFLHEKASFEHVPKKLDKT